MKERASMTGMAKPILPRNVATASHGQDSGLHHDVKSSSRGDRETFDLRYDELSRNTELAGEGICDIDLAVAPVDASHGVAPSREKARMDSLTATGIEDGAGCSHSSGQKFELDCQ
jgi:hypothetical protein